MVSVIIDCSAGMKIELISDKKNWIYDNDDIKKHSDDILIELDNLLHQAKLNVRDINNVCVCTGPGSFTGIRVAISVAKGLAIGIGAKVYVCSNLDAFENKENKKSVFVLGGFSEFIYVRIYSGKTYEDRCLQKSELKDNFSEYKIYVLNEKTQNLLILSEINAQICQNNIKNVFLNKIKFGENIEIEKIEPIYLRASQAEIERNKKLNGAV